MKCYLCEIDGAQFDASLSPGGFPQPGREVTHTQYGEVTKPEDARCMRCYVGYPPRDSDGKFWWEHLPPTDPEIKKKIMELRSRQ